MGLREALQLIESSGDSSLVGTRDYRNADQRDYLANKAYCRYLSNKLDVMGIYDAVTSDSWVRRDLKADGFKLNKEGHAAFGFDPEWSYADDYEEWGYNTKPKRSSIAAFKANKYADDDSYDFAGREAESWDNYQRGNTTGDDFGLDTSALGKAQTKPQWLLDMERYIIGGGPAPDEVSGRFETREDYDKAVAILSAAPPEEVPAVWDVYNEGVEDGDFVFDTVQNQYVPPKDKTPGLIYDAESGKYIKPGTEDDAAAEARKAARQAARQAARDSKKAADDPATLPVDVGEQSPEDFIKSLGQGGGGWKTFRLVL